MSRSAGWFIAALVLFIIGAVCVLDWYFDKIANFIPHWPRLGGIVVGFIGGLVCFGFGCVAYRE